MNSRKQRDLLAAAAIAFCAVAAVVFPGPDEFLAIGALVGIIHFLTR